MGVQLLCIIPITVVLHGSLVGSSFGCNICGFAFTKLLNIIALVMYGIAAVLAMMQVLIAIIVSRMITIF